MWLAFYGLSVAFEEAGPSFLSSGNLNDHKTRNKEVLHMFSRRPEQTTKRSPAALWPDRHYITAQVKKEYHQITLTGDFQPGDI